MKLVAQIIGIFYSSIFQDVPLHTLEEFFELAPEELRKDEVKENEHQLMLNRLSFELSERQRFVFLSFHLVILIYSYIYIDWKPNGRNSRNRKKNS